MNETEKILVLDLDKTLIHSTETKLENEFDFDFRYAEYFIYKRSNLINFLTEMSKFFKLAIWL